MTLKQQDALWQLRLEHQDRSVRPWDLENGNCVMQIGLYRRDGSLRVEREVLVTVDGSTPWASDE